MSPVDAAEGKQMTLATLGHYNFLFHMFGSWMGDGMGVQ